MCVYIYIYMHIHFTSVYIWHMYMYILCIMMYLILYHNKNRRLYRYNHFPSILLYHLGAQQSGCSAVCRLQDPWLLDLKEKQAIAKQEEDGNEGNLGEVCHSPTFSKAESHHRYKWSAEKRSEATLYTLHVWFQLLVLVFWGSSSVCEVFFPFIPIWRKKTRVGNEDILVSRYHRSSVGDEITFYHPFWLTWFEERRVHFCFGAGLF